MITRKCPKCGRTAQVRVERVVKAADYRTNYVCTRCGETWTTTARPPRKPPKREHAWFS